MFDIINVGMSLTQGIAPLVPEIENLPFPFGAAFRIVHMVNFCSYTWDNIDAISNFREAAFASNVVSFVFGEHVVQEAAKIAIIARGSLHLSRAINRVHEATRHLDRSVNRVYPVTVTVLYDDDSKICQSTFDYIVYTIEKIVSAFFEVYRRLWEVSSALIEVSQAFIMDKIARYQTINMAGVNTVRLYKELTDNPQRLLLELEQNADKIDAILQAMSSPLLVRDITQKIKQIAPYCQIDQSAQNVLNTIADLGTRTTFELGFLVSGRTIEPLMNLDELPVQTVTEGIDHGHDSYSSPTRKTRRHVYR